MIIDVVSETSRVAVTSRICRRVNGKARMSHRRSANDAFRFRASSPAPSITDAALAATQLLPSGHASAYIPDSRKDPSKLH